MEEDIYRSQFRLPYTLYELLKASADENHRSVNAELVARLESTFKKMDLVRHTLGFPLTDPDADQDEAQDAQSRPFSGPSKKKILASIDEPLTESEGEILGTIVKYLRQARVEQTTMCQPISEQVKPKPQPNTGPKPRKLKPKE